MTLSEMFKRSEEGTLHYVLLKDISLALGNRFRMYDVLEDIKESIDLNLFNISKIDLSQLNDDTLELGIKYKSDNSKHEFSIIIKSVEILNRYLLIDNTTIDIKPGLFSTISKLKNSKNMKELLIENIIKNNG